MKINKEKAEYIAIALHHLRTPLIGTDWALKMLIHGDMGPINAEQKDYLTKCYDGNRKALNFISDILTVDKLERDLLGYTFTDVHIGLMIDSLIKESALEVSEKKIKLITNKDNKGIPIISGDERKLFIVLENLFQNAIKYTPAEGVITLNVVTDSDHVSISIKDTGIGIPSHEQIRIFEQFFRASNAQKLHEEGSGIGLFMSKSIVEKHGGKMSFDSKDGEGTTFYIHLPIKK